MRSLRRTFNNKINIYRLSSQEDNFGGKESSFKKVLWDVPCRIYGMAGAGFRITYEGTEYFVADKMICEKTVDIKNGDKILEHNTQRTYLVVLSKVMYNLKKISHLEIYLAQIEAEVK